jgi:molybdate transport system substrate-binding protein
MTKLRFAAIRLSATIALAAASGAACADDLAVAADASLAEALQDIGKSFEANHPGSHVTFTFAASGALLQQLAQGTAADVFASADEATMDKAQKQNLINGSTRVVFAGNTLVLIVPASTESPPSSAADILHANFHRVAIGNPALSPAGRYAQEALDIAGIRSEIEQKLLPTESVRQALFSVDHGDADAGIVYGSDAQLEKDKVKTALTLPTKTPIHYSAGVTVSNHKDALAKAFIAYLQSADGRTVLQKYGFTSP